jgi:hypothetical protein
MKGLPYEVKSLLEKARESATLAVETYNRPTASFRSGAYVVLMIIAWTSLFHALFLRKKIKPYRRKVGSVRFERRDGERCAWDLKECIVEHFGGNQTPVRTNLEFFIGLRNKLEHRSLANLDPEVFGECQALLLNFENLLVTEFGRKYAIRGGLTFTLQFTQSPRTALTVKAKKDLQEVKDFVDSFRSSLSTNVTQNMEYSFKVYLVPKIAANTSRDAPAVEFVKYDSSKPDEMERLEKIVALIKPRELLVANEGLLKPKAVVDAVARRLGKPFSQFDHKLCYQHFRVRPLRGAANPRGVNQQFCVYDELHKDYGYQPVWVDFICEKLADPSLYKSIISSKKKSQVPIDEEQ